MLLFATAAVFLLPTASSVALFGMTCEKTPQLYSEWTDCLLPGGNLIDLIKSFYTDVQKLECQMPPKKMLRYATAFLKSNAEYLEHPLYKRIPSQRCGSCPRRLRCCKRSSSFLAQAYDSELCPGFDSACFIDPLNPDDLRRLGEIYPNATTSADGCDVSSYVQAEFQILKKGAAFQYVEPLLCQVVGTKLPAVNCVRRDDQCLCCCSGFRPNADGKCVADPTDTQYGCH